jgi:hyperosmotically inducible protein
MPAKVRVGSDRSGVDFMVGVPLGWAGFYLVAGAALKFRTALPCGSRLDHKWGAPALKLPAQSRARPRAPELTFRSSVVRATKCSEVRRLMSGKKAWITALGAACVLVASGAFANDAVGKSDQPMTDTVITTKVKAELTKDDTTKAREISVTTKNGVVHLSGVVDSITAKQKAEEDARAIKGVVDVSNNLNVTQR